MKKIFFTLCLCTALAPIAGAAEDCAPTAEACKQKASSSSPFMAALANAQPAQAPLKPAPPAQAETKQEPAAPVQPAALPATRSVFSNPLWSLAAIGLIAGVYFFLRETKKRGKR